MSDQRPRDVPDEIEKLMQARQDATYQELLKKTAEAVNSPNWRTEGAGRDTYSVPYLKGEAGREQAYLEREAKREQMEERIEEIKEKIGRACSTVAPIMFGVGVLLIVIGIFYVLIPFILTGVISGGTVFARHLSGGVLCLIISWLSWLIGEILE